MKLTSQQIDDSFRTVYTDTDIDYEEECWLYDEEMEDHTELEPLQCYQDDDIDEVAVRTSISRKELRSKAVRDREGIVGHGEFKKRKY